MGDNVVQLRAPNVISRNYKDHTVTLELDRERGVWSWSFTHTKHYSFGGEAPTVEDALKSAYKLVDKMTE